MPIFLKLFFDAISSIFVFSINLFCLCFPIRILMPDDNLGLDTLGSAGESWIPQLSSTNMDDPDTSRTLMEDSSFSSSRPSSSAKNINLRRKSANRRSTENISATPTAMQRESLHSSHGVPIPSPQISDIKYTMPRARSKTGQRHRAFTSTDNEISDSQNMDSSSRLSSAKGVPEMLGQQSSRSNTQTRVGSSKGAASSRFGVDILPSKSGLATSQNISSSRSQKRGDITDSGHGLPTPSSSSRETSQQMFSGKFAQSGNMSREASRVSVKNSRSARATPVTRHRSNLDQTQRPASSTLLSGASSHGTAKEVDRRQRPNSSTGRLWFWTLCPLAKKLFMFKGGAE